MTAKRFARTITRFFVSNNNVTFADKAIKHGSWFVLFKGASQTVSWLVTVFVARLLSPADYALSAMATLITGYAELLSEMGIGASIIQKKAPTDAELSSIFWFSLGVGVLFALACVPIAFLTARIFDEPAVIPLVLSVSVLFVLTGLEVVPVALLKRELNYKVVGMIEMQTTIVSCFAMLLIAYLGGGVWTLIGGRLIRGFVRVVLVYRATAWRPRLVSRQAEIRGYLRFGVLVATSSSAFYLFSVSDRFFAGRAWTVEALGFYLFAMQLAQVPVEKLVSTINHVSYALLSRHQDNLEELASYYLKTIRLTATLVFPIFVGGYLVGEELIPILLGEKWTPMITLFRYLCLAQVLVTLNAVVGFVHMALGKPQKGLMFNVSCALLMSASYFAAVKFGGQEKEAMLVPWFTTYLVISIVWLTTTNINLAIKPTRYLYALKTPAIGVTAMTILVYAGDVSTRAYELSAGTLLIGKMAIAVATYGITLWVIDPQLLKSIRALRT